MGVLFNRLIATLIKNQVNDDRLTIFTRINAIPANTTPASNEKRSGLVKVSANSVTFMEKITAELPANAKITTPTKAIIAILINFPASGGGALLSLDVLYKLTKLC